jgi:capsule biosynthesis phosphatase
VLTDGGSIPPSSTNKKYKKIQYNSILYNLKTFMKKKIVIDLDNTLTIKGGGTDYANATPNLDAIQKLRSYKRIGFEISIYTARNMQTYKNSIGLITANTLPIIIKWLKKHKVPFSEIYVGKPWCGDEGFYVDDKTIRPDEFVCLDYKDIKKLIKLK